MHRNKPIKRGRAVPIRIVPLLLAGGFGYLIGCWQFSPEPGEELSATGSIAQRFPQDWDKAPIAMQASTWSGAARTAQSDAPFPAADQNIANTIPNAQTALLSPEPMVPQMDSSPPPQSSPSVAAEPTLPITQETSATPAPQANLPPAPHWAIGARPAVDAKSATAAAHRAETMLNDAQIASIKARLHLTADQERMWPAVEAALRNMAYTRAQEARRRGSSPTNTQAAAIDPNAVQGLKSAAVPLIMSFNAEQKEEVRNLAHVMGLDQLASQF